MAKRTIVWLSGFGSLLLTGFTASSGPVPLGLMCFQDPQETPAQPDNTKKKPSATNHHDANRADQQSNSSSDVELTRKIRRALTQDKSLSTYAHNVKIITRDGVVELKGLSGREPEKDAVEAKVTDIKR